MIALTFAHLYLLYLYTNRYRNKMMWSYVCVCICINVLATDSFSQILEWLGRMCSGQFRREMHPMKLASILLAAFVRLLKGYYTRISQAMYHLRAFVLCLVHLALIIRWTIDRFVNDTLMRVRPHLLNNWIISITPDGIPVVRKYIHYNSELLYTTPLIHWDAVCYLSILHLFSL